MRKIDVSTDMLVKVVDEHKEKWRQELQDIEQRRNDLLPEHQKMQKLSQKLQSVQDKKKQCPKNVGRCAREHRHVRIVTEKLVGKNEDNGFGSQKLAGWRWEAR